MPLSEQTATEVQDLAWALADDMSSPTDVTRLEELLLADPDARKLYVQCMQLQADLHLYFNPKLITVPNLPLPAAAAPAQTAVIKSLPNTGSSSTPASV
jgi:hypothetical protein